MRVPGSKDTSSPAPSEEGARRPSFGDGTPSASTPTRMSTPTKKVRSMFTKVKTPPQLPRGSSGLGEGKPLTPGRGDAQQRLAAEATQAAGSGGGGNDNERPAHSGDTLESYVLPPSLQGGAGMEVIKVSKNGKQQARRLGIAPNHRAIYITTHKMLGSAGQMKEVDLSRVVRTQLGQQSRRFVKAREKADTSNAPQSLSIIYRRSYSAKDKLVKTMKKGQVKLDSAEDSLDLVVPSRADFEALTRTLEDLLAFYQEEEPWANPDYAWIQYHLADMGKSLGDKLTVSCADWVTLCKRWNAPVSKAEAAAMYKSFCESLAISNASTDGLEMFEVVRLLEVLRQKGLTSSALGGCPRKKLFLKIAQSKSGDSRAISAVDFLAFVRDRQGETDMALKDVRELFYQLNGHRVSPQLNDALTVLSADYRDGTQREGEAVSWEKGYITFDAFAKYLLLESNDAFDPVRASPQSNLNEPLNNYWINTSHDTYLRRTKASSADQKQAGKTDLQSYTLALYRGARAIELDVWDGPGGPVVRFGVSSFSKGTANKSSSSTSSLPFKDVLLTISYFLQSEPESLPVILLIENHCSLPFQKKMTSQLEAVLGKQDLLYRPDPSAKETDALPSPAQLRGKVVIKSKLPERILGESVALNDDFDDENRDATPPSFTDYDSEDDVKENVAGFTSTGSIKSATPQKLTGEQLYHTAKAESNDAYSAWDVLRNELEDVTHQAQQSDNHAAAMLRDIGMTFEELKKQREESHHDMVEEGTEVELCVDGASKVKETADQAMEVAKAFAESVEESRLLALAATTEARSETEVFDVARDDLTDKEAVLAEANEELREVSKGNADLEEAAERALSEARTNREYAENAERRVAAVRGLVDRSHNQAVSSETVAGTADAEAKISEQRATDAEARYEKARASADQEKKNAEKEEAELDDYDTQLIAAKRELGEVKGKVDAARERADDAVNKADKLTDEIREARSMGMDDEMSVAESTDVRNKKSKERKAYLGKMEEALTDKLGLESNTRKLENKIDDLQRKANLQAKIAASARRQADHSMSVADQLEEHALEEREAADLRQAARDKAKQGVESSDAVLTSTEAQLEEAEKAVVEANAIALASRQNAEQLAKEAEAVQDIASMEEAVRIAREHRDAAYAFYESARESKEEALKAAAKAKQVHETNVVNLGQLERDAMAELLHKESAQQAELMALTACENASALNDRVEGLKKKCDEAKALAKEKSGALEIATRYREKRRRLQPLSPALANLTLLHSANQRNWDKSVDLPQYALHSVPDAKLVKSAEEGMEEWKRWVDFNKTHFSRTYPGSAARNYNPIIPWALGSQFVSMNFIRNKFMLLNDGRFRENGGQGYVLKPEYLTNTDGKDVVGGSALNCTNPKQLIIKVLSGLCLPKSPEKKASSSSNPFVRVTLYDASPASLLPSPSFKTQVVEGNGLNPVWPANEAATFNCLNPSVGMLLFAVYDHCDVTKADLFVGASAIPVSCLREGYRCVPLFDSNNTRSGAMKYASLFVKVQVE